MNKVLTIFIVIVILIVIFILFRQPKSTFQNELLDMIKDIPIIDKNPLNYVFENLELQKNPDEFWLEFGVYSGNTINYISKFTNDKVYGFDSFEGLPEKWTDQFDKGAFKVSELPKVNDNVVLVKGWFDETLPTFIKEQNVKKVAFLHMDADLYSSTKTVFDNLKNYMTPDCIIVFDELINYPGFDGDKGELKAFYEFVNDNNINYEWIGKHNGGNGQQVAVKILT